MLDRSYAPRKNSLGNLSNLRRARRLGSEKVELPVGQSGQQRFGGRRRERRVAQQRLEDPAAQPPTRVCRDRLQGSGAGPRLGGGLHDVRFRSEPVVQDRAQDASVGVQAEDEKASPPGQARDGDPFGDRHLRKPPEELGVGGPPDVGVHAGVRREVSEVTPVQRLHQGERVRPGGVAVPRDCEANRVEPAGFRVPEHLRDLVAREIRPPELLEKPPLDPHGDY